VLEYLDRAPIPEPEEREGVVSYRELIYSSPVGFRPLAIDLHIPRADLPPLVVYIHGGAFRLGHRNILPAAVALLDPFTRLPPLGIAVATVDYRLSGEARYPACVEDVAAAISWLRERATELGVDAGRIATWGESAGAYLAVRAGNGFSGVDPVQAIVSWYAPVDFGSMGKQGAPWTDEADSPESQLMGAPVPTIPEAVEEASLLSSISAQSPPTLIMHGTGDHLIPFQQADMLHDAYRAAGATSTKILIEGADHAFPEVDPETLRSPVWAFLCDQLLR